MNHYAVYLKHIVNQLYFNKKINLKNKKGKKCNEKK